jgi:predicted alpha/beta hydrolase
VTLREELARASVQVARLRAGVDEWAPTASRDELIDVAVATWAVWLSVQDLLQQLGDDGEH